MSLSPSLRVLIIDGHLAVGRGLKALVDEMPGLHVVGLATRGERGLAQAARVGPDVALVDAELPGLCSAAVVTLLRWRLPNTRIVALGMYPERRRAALDAGAHAFVLKDAGYDALRAAIGGETDGSEHRAHAPHITDRRGSDMGGEACLAHPRATARRLIGAGGTSADQMDDSGRGTPGTGHAAVGNEEREPSCH